MPEVSRFHSYKRIIQPVLKGFFVGISAIVKGQPIEIALSAVQATTRTWQEERVMPTGPADGGTITIGPGEPVLELVLARNMIVGAAPLIESLVAWQVTTR